MIFLKINGNRFPFMARKRFSVSNHHNCSVNDRYKFSKLLSDCFKFGEIEDAEKLFDKMPHKDVVSWSIAVHGYAINGMHGKSIDSFSRMRLLGLVPNSFTVVGLLVSVAGLRDLVFAHSVHGLILKGGLDSNLIVSTALLNIYAKCGNVFDSYRVFNGLKNPGLVSCNAIITGFINNGLSEEAFKLFHTFRKFGLIPNTATVLSLIRGSVAVETRSLCECIHGLIVKLGLNLDLAVNNSVLGMYSNLMDLDASSKIFGEIEYKDVISWTTMMGLLVDLEHAYDAMKLFHRMRWTEVDYDMVVFFNLISACTILGDLRRGKEVHTLAIVCGFILDLHITNSIIAMYSKCGNLDSSRSVFDQTIDKSLVSWTVMISGYACNGCPGEALNLFINARLEENNSFDSLILTGALTATGELAALELCQQLHCYAFTIGFPQYRSVQNSLISAYSKCGNVDFAYSVFKDMGYLQDVVSWNAIINGYGINGHGETALSLYHDMKKCGEDPDGTTYLCILSACSHAGLVSDGLIIFNQLMKGDKILPSQEHYGCVVDLLVRAGRMPDAVEFAGKFFKGTSTNVWMALLGGCMLNGNVEQAEYVARIVSEQDPRQPDQAVLLSNIYASVGRFQDAEALRLSMHDKGMLKIPGISFLNEISCDRG